MNKNDFIQIIKDHQRLIFKVSSTYCYDPENRKDLEQDILIQLWDSMKRYDGSVKLSTWIYRIALNTAISDLRKSSKRRTRRVQSEDYLFISDEHTAKEHTENLEQLRILISELNSYEKALILLYLEDVAYEEIAKILGITKTNVSTKINRIKNKLKQQFLNA